MKKSNLVFILLCTMTVLFCGCKENSLDSSDILRRIRLRNTPEDVMVDLVTALQKGNAKALYTLSTDRIQNIMENYGLFAEENMEFGEILKNREKYLKNNYSNWLLSSKPVKKDKKICTFELIMQKPGSGEIKTLSIKLILDKQKNWKNDTRF